MIHDIEYNIYSINFLILKHGQCRHYSNRKWQKIIILNNAGYWCRSQGYTALG